MIDGHAVGGCPIRRKNVTSSRRNVTKTAQKQHVNRFSDVLVTFCNLLVTFFSLSSYAVVIIKNGGT